MPNRFTIQLSHTQATLLSLGLTSGVAVSLLTAIILFGDQQMGQLAVAGLGGLVVTALMFTHPPLGIYLLIITIYTNMSTVLGRLGVPSINKPLAALAFVTIATSYFWGQKPLPRLKLVEWAMILMGSTWLLSGLTAVNPYAVRLRTLDFAKDVLILLCIIWALQKRVYWQQAIWVLILSATALALLSCYQVVTGHFEQTFWGFAGIKEDQVITELYQNRLSGPLGDPNFYGMMLVAALPLAVYRLLEEKEKGKKVAAGLCCAALIFTILNTYSRGALFATLITGFIITIERHINLKIIFTLSFMGLLALPFLPEGYGARVASLNSVVGEGAAVQNEISVRGRTSELISGILMFVDHPVLGIGAGNYSDQYQNYAKRIGLEYRSTAREAHSLYVEFLAEIGSLGSLAFILLVVSWFARLRAIRATLIAQKQLPEAAWIASLMMSVTGYLLCSLFLHGDYIRYLWLYISLGAAAIHLGPAGLIRHE